MRARWLLLILRKYAVRYHNSDFISSDPVQFPHRYHSKADIEISAFLTAFLSFGARPQILKAAERLDSIMNRQPLQYVLSGNWKIDFCGEESFYRTVSKIRWHNCFIGCILYIIGMRVWRMLFFAKRMELRCNVFAVCLECRIRRRKEIEYVPALDDPSRFGSGFWNLEEFLSM